MENVCSSSLLASAGRPRSRLLLFLAAVAVLLVPLLGWPVPAAHGAGSWAPAAPLHAARSHQSAVHLKDGRVLVMGGELVSGSSLVFLSSVEAYDPSSDSWKISASMATARADFTAIVLPDGRVLVAGGANGTGYLGGAEIYDPTLDSWQPAGSMSTPRSNYSVTLLRSGLVLVAGGYNSSGAVNVAELYDFVSNSWKMAAPMAVARGSHTATRLPDGRVLVAGGFNQAPVAGAEIYDPSADSWSQALPLNIARYGHTATLLKDGTVLVAGGFTSSGAATNSTEIYDPIQSRAWNTAGNMNDARGYHTATLLSDGSVLVAGGKAQSGGVSHALATAEVFNPGTDQWTTAGTMTDARQNHTATPMDNGRVLVAGGTGSNGELANAEVYTPAQPPATATSTSTPIPPTATPNPPTSTPIPPTSTPIGTATPTPITPVASPTELATSTPVGSTATPTATPAPAKPDFNIAAVRAEINSTTADWKFAHPALQHLAIGSKFMLSVYIRFISIPDRSRVTIDGVLTESKRVLHRFGSSRVMNSSDTGDLWEHTSYVAAHSGIYTLTATVIVGKVKKSAVAYFTVAPASPHISFQFSSLRSLDQRGKASSVFGATQRVYITATWKVAGVPNAAPLRVFEALQRPAGSGWKALGNPLENVFDTSDGTHSYQFTFVPGSAFSSMRIVVSVTIGHASGQRAIVIHVQR